MEKNCLDFLQPCWNLKLHFGHSQLLETRDPVALHVTACRSVFLTKIAQLPQYLLFSSHLLAWLANYWLKEVQEEEEGGGGGEEGEEKEEDFSIGTNSSDIIWLLVSPVLTRKNVKEQVKLNKYDQTKELEKQKNKCKIAIGGLMPF